VDGVTIARIRTVARAHARELGRRHVALGLLVLLPLAFYGSASAAEGSFVLITGGMGVAWALTGAGLFVTLGARRLAPRLVLAGYRPAEILAGQMGLPVLGSLPLVAIFAALMIALEGPQHPGAVVAAVVLAGLISVPLGLLLGSVVRNELEGTLALIGVLGVQMSLPATVAGAAALPFYGSMTLLEHAYGTDVSEGAAVPHALMALALLVVGAFASWVRRVRVRA
jgi:hypothetical protein